MTTSHLPRTSFTVGQKVRYVGTGRPINHGSIGTIIRMGTILDDCPVVNFPYGAHGPHSDFLFITHARDLELI